MDIGVLDSVLERIMVVCTGNGTIMGYAKSLFNLLMAIDFIVAILMNMISFNSQSYITMTVQKILKYGFWIWIIQLWPELITAIIQSLMEAGSSLGSLDPGVLRRPSEIIDMGFTYSAQYFDYLNQSSISYTNIGKVFVMYILSLIAGLGIMTAFGFIALNAFVTYVEFYVVSILLLLFVPFAANDKTSRFAENALGFIMGTGVKLMMMGAIVSLTVNESNVMSYVAKGGEGPTYQEAFVAITLSWTFAWLACEVPAIAGAAMSGSPTLSGHNLLAHSMGTMAMGYGAISAGVGMGMRGAASAAGAYVAGGGGSSGLGSIARAAGNAMTSSLTGAYSAGGDAASTRFADYHYRNAKSPGSRNNMAPPVD